MKVETTRKALVSAYPNAIAISYCGAYHLLYYQQPYYYTCGVYGWNMDGYVIDGVLITTGYRGMIGKKVDCQLLEQYETQAKKNKP